MQEVDCSTLDPARKDSWCASLERAGYKTVFAARLHKPIHGLAIAYKADKFEQLVSRTIYYESMASVGRSASEAETLGSENVAQLLALRVRGPFTATADTTATASSAGADTAAGSGAAASVKVNAAAAVRIAPVLLLSNTHLNWRHQANWLKTRQIHTLLTGMAGFAATVPKAVPADVWAGLRDMTNTNDSIDVAAAAAATTTTAAPEAASTATAAAVSAPDPPVPTVPIHVTCGDFNITPTTAGYALFKHRISLPGLPPMEGTRRPDAAYAVGRYWTEKMRLEAAGDEAAAAALPIPLERGDRRVLGSDSCDLLPETWPAWLRAPLDAALGKVSAAGASGAGANAAVGACMSGANAAFAGLYGVDSLYCTSSSATDAVSVTVAPAACALAYSAAAALASPLHTLAHLAACAANSASGASDLSAEIAAMQQRELLGVLLDWASVCEAAHSTEQPATAVTAAETAVAAVAGAEDPVSALVAMLAALRAPYTDVRAEQITALAAKKAADAAAAAAKAAAKAAAAAAATAAAAAADGDCTQLLLPGGDSEAEPATGSDETVAPTAGDAVAAADVSEDGHATWLRLCTGPVTAHAPTAAEALCLPAPATVAAAVSAALGLLAGVRLTFEALAAPVAATEAAAAAVRSRLSRDAEAALATVAELFAADVAPSSETAPAASTPSSMTGAAAAGGDDDDSTGVSLAVHGPAALAAAPASFTAALGGLTSPRAAAGLLQLTALGAAAGPLLLSAVPAAPAPAVLAAVGQWATESALRAALAWLRSLAPAAVPLPADDAAACADVRVRALLSPYSVVITQRTVDQALMALHFAAGASTGAAAQGQLQSASVGASAAAAAAWVPVMPYYRSSYEAYPALPAATDLPAAAAVSARVPPACTALAEALDTLAAALPASVATAVTAAPGSAPAAAAAAVAGAADEAATLSAALARAEALASASAYAGYGALPPRPFTAGYTGGAAARAVSPVAARFDQPAVTATGMWSGALDYVFVPSAPVLHALPAAPARAAAAAAAPNAEAGAAIVATRVDVVALLPLPSPAEIAKEVALPNSERGSDHLPVAARVQLRFTLV
jgi:hypothetical protein